VHVGPSLRGARELSFGSEDAYVSPVEDMAAVDAFIAVQREALEKEKVAYAVRNSAAHGKELA
jgi:hypothetical protein